MTTVSSYPHYPFPWKTGLQLLRDVTLIRSRSARADSIVCIHSLTPQPKIFNPENILDGGPGLLTTNHYARPGFQAWWIALGISAAVPLEIHWLMTASWTFSDRKFLRVFTPLTSWLFSRVAQVYGFTTTPPMPPDPKQVEERAQSVRRVLKYARETANPVIAIAPEGYDHPGGILGTPPSGAGRFIAQLSKYCQRIVPIGVYEEDESLCIRFGPPFELEIAPKRSADDLDQHVSRQVMQAIARQLPDRLRGAYKD